MYVGRKPFNEVPEYYSFKKINEIDINYMFILVGKNEMCYRHTLHTLKYIKYIKIH